MAEPEKYERKLLRYVKDADQSDPAVRTYDNISRYTSYAVSIFSIFMLTWSNAIGYMHPILQTIVKLLVFIVLTIFVDFFLQKLIFERLVKHRQDRNE